MTLSDDLTKLSARAKEAEERFAAAQKSEHDKVEHDVQSARESLEKSTDQLRNTAQANKGKVAAWWNDVQKSWDEQIASIRRDIESKKAEHDVKAAQRKADSAEEDARFAIQYAYWAVEEAEYAVLDAQLARMDAASRS
jgi:flagellar hook-length control protein FliK